jgi:hypothetical protein
VRLTGSGRALAVLAAALAIAAAGAFVGLLAIVSGQRARAAAFAADGVRVEATITNVRRNGGDDSGRRATYRFVAAGEALTGTVRLRSRDRRAVGDRLTVVYLPSAPATHYVLERGLRGAPIVLVPLVPLALLGGAALCAIALQRQRRLVEEGRPVLAVVTGSRKVQHQHGAYFTVTYEFRLMSGAPRKGSFQVQKNPPDAGTRVLVIYDRERPEHNRRYPPALATAAPGQ